MSWTISKHSMIQHIYPTDETERHILTSSPRGIGIPYCSCPCVVRYEADDAGGWLIVHSSFDGREGLEEANDILNGG